MIDSRTLLCEAVSNVVHPSREYKFALLGVNR